MQPRRMLVTDAATQPPRQSSVWLISTLGRKIMKFVALYETTTFDGQSFELLAKPAKLEFFNGVREFHVFAQFTRVVTAPRSGELQLGGNIKIVTAPARHYLAIHVRVPDSVELLREAADAIIDATIVKLASLYGDELLRNQIYRGPVISDGESAMGSFDVKVAPEMVALSAAEVESRIEAVDSYLFKNPDHRDRLQLASSFYASALLLPPCEQRFLLEWTILEVFPMKDTTHIQPLKEFVANRTGRSIADIEAKLQIGKLYGVRCDLVHNGKFPKGKEGFDIMEKVYRLSNEAVFHLCGRPYQGGLDHLLK